MAVVASIRQRRKDEESRESEETKEKTQEKTQPGDTKAEYAVVNKPKPARRQSAPEPSYRSYSKAVTSLSTTNENTPVNGSLGLSNGSYDYVHDSPQQSYQNENVGEKHYSKPSILKPRDSIGSVDSSSSRHVTIDEGYSRHPRTLSVPKKVIPVPPPVVKYPIEPRKSRTYEQMGTTLL